MKGVQHGVLNCPNQGEHNYQNETHSQSAGCLTHMEIWNCFPEQGVAKGQMDGQPRRVLFNFYNQNSNKDG